MKLAYVLLALPLFGFSCTSGSGDKPRIESGEYTKTIKEGDLQRSYILRVPKGYDNKTNLPLVVLLHGWTSNAAQMELGTGFGAKADKEGFILVVPNGTEGIGNAKGWNTGFLNLGSPKADDTKLVEDLIDEAEKDLYVDENRVYVAGHSNGAMMSYTVASKLGDRIAAIGVVSGSVGVQDQHVPDLKGPVSAIIFHGKLDPTVPYDLTSKGLIMCTPAPDSAKWWADKDGCGPGTETVTRGKNVVIRDFTGGKGGSEVELVTTVDGDHSWPKGIDDNHVSATDMIWDFFKAHPRRR